MRRASLESTSRASLVGSQEASAEKILGAPVLQRILRAVRAVGAIPWLLLAGLLLGGIITVFTQASHYGITTDEPLQQLYGDTLLLWYRSHGQDTTFITQFGRPLRMPEHGGIVDTVIASFQARFVGVDPWLVRHIANGVIGWLGMVAIALCGYELGGGWVALIAATGLWLYPRYYGAIYNNPKDIPAAVFMTFVLWATLLLLRYWGSRKRALEVGAILGILLGMATAIRVTSVIWYGILLMLLVGWWVTHGADTWRQRRVIIEAAWQSAIGGVIVATWLLTTIALWPFVFLNPVANLIEAAQVMAHFPWFGNILFNGVVYPATQLPWTYLPTWLVIGSPPIALALAALGVCVAGARMIHGRPVEVAQGVVALAFALPLALILVGHAIVYDTLRQILFIIPPLLLLAASGLVESVRFLMRHQRRAARWTAVALLALTVLSYAQVVADMVALSPYEYMYFSPLVGGLRGAANHYDTDYWAECRKPAAEWLAQNYRSYTSAKAPVIASESILEAMAMTPYLPASFHSSATDPDFFIGITRDNDYLRYPGYRTIHVVSVEGVALCVVKVNPATVTAWPPVEARASTVLPAYAPLRAPGAGAMVDWPDVRRAGRQR